MAFCASCGSTVEGRFCPKCGAAVGEAPGAPPASQQPASPPPAAGAGGMSDNVAAALCYLAGFITGIIFLVVAPYNQNKAVRFHAFQSIFFSVGMVILSIALTIFSTIMFAISFWLGSLLGLTYMVLWLAILVLWLYLMWKAYQGQKVMLPVIGELAQKQA